MKGLALYDQLPVFTTFAELTDERHFTRLPADWSVIIADLEGSTAAIADGRYRDVNTLGAACIAVAQNALGRRDFPFVFGGDGATIVLPPEPLPQVLAALVSLQALAREQFGMGLRIGVVRVEEIETGGEQIQLARYQLFEGKSIAFFTGGGLTYAERLVKGDPAAYAPTEAPAAHSLAGLSCRWNAIPNRRGLVLSLLVMAVGEDQPRIYDQVIGELNTILDGMLEDFNPVNLPLMTYRSLRELLRSERRYHPRKGLAYWYRMTEIVLAVMVFKLGFPAIGFNPKHYASVTPLHADYRKFDDLLRMVIDCSAEQADAIESALAARHQQGELCYGLHRSETSLMTCLVEGLGDGQHLHFIDGSDGGYAVAAKQLKRQIKTLRERP